MDANLGPRWHPRRAATGRHGGAGVGRNQRGADEAPSSWRTAVSAGPHPPPRRSGRLRVHPPLGCFSPRACVTPFNMNDAPAQELTRRTEVTTGATGPFRRRLARPDTGRSPDRCSRPGVCVPLAAAPLARHPRPDVTISEDSSESRGQVEGAAGGRFRRTRHVDRGPRIGLRALTLCAMRATIQGWREVRAPRRRPERAPAGKQRRDSDVQSFDARGASAPDARDGERPGARSSKRREPRRRT